MARTRNLFSFTLVSPLTLCMLFAYTMSSTRGENVIEEILIPRNFCHQDASRFMLKKSQRNTLKIPIKSF